MTRDDPHPAGVTATPTGKPPDDLYRACPNQVFKRDETIKVAFDLDTHEVVSISSALEPFGWIGWER